MKEKLDIQGARVCKLLYMCMFVCRCVLTLAQRKFWMNSLQSIGFVYILGYLSFLFV
jgi:hypothetical protein